MKKDNRDNLKYQTEKLNKKMRELKKLWILIFPLLT